ncbi:MAG: nucleotide pyrophosphohydrolase [Candidatus Lokiarchaeota archaeon]|nr:nucleotide pyrophosphohydrolase [Candidatus Lokiarchaeota archaeon]MBD3202436.1 nucleotide pyrophosphohydrolase [Candidatus Lokiarchaeota archaeon]
MKIDEFQNLMKDLYLHQDSERGIERTFLWLVEEVGELSSLLKEKRYDKIQIAEEMADVLAWTCSLANLLNINLEKACFRKYPNVCSKCKKNPCICGKK